MLQPNLNYFFKLGVIRPMGNDQFHDKTSERPEHFSKAPILHELGRIVRSAYEQGVSLEEAYAICGAAYGDWRETSEARTPRKLQLAVAQVRK